MRLWMLAAFLAGGAFAQKSTESTGDYRADLSQVYGAIMSVEDMADICSKEFPRTAKSNRRAYDSWRKQYSPFGQEMESHFLAMTWQESKQDPFQHVRVLSGYAKAFKGNKAILRQQLASESPDAFRKQCENYPGYLKSARMDLESYYADQVATIRRGLK